MDAVSPTLLLAAGLVLVPPEGVIRIRRGMVQAHGCAVRADILLTARHVIEDTYNPFNLLREMNRVGKAGYIETPSPIAELARGIDGNSPAYRGYHHHRFMTWVHGDQLRVISKYTLVEYIKFAEERTIGWLQQGSKYWNTYYLWKDKLNFVHRQNGIDFRLDDVSQYGQVLNGAMEASKAATDMFWQQMSEIHQQPRLLETA